MGERELAAEWVEMRRRSIGVLPVAIAIFTALCLVVYVENLYSSHAGFLPGVLVGIAGYWVVLEAMTVVRVGRLLQRASQVESGSPPT